MASKLLDGRAKLLFTRVKVRPSHSATGPIVWFAATVLVLTTGCHELRPEFPLPTTVDGVKDAEPPPAPPERSSERAPKTVRAQSEKTPAQKPPAERGLFG